MHMTSSRVPGASVKAEPVQQMLVVAETAEQSLLVEQVLKEPMGLDPPVPAGAPAAVDSALTHWDHWDW